MSDQPNEALNGIALAISKSQGHSGVLILATDPNAFGLCVPQNEGAAILRALPAALRQMADKLEQDLQGRDSTGSVEVEEVQGEEEEEEEGDLGLGEVPDADQIPTLPDVLPEACICGRSQEVGFGECCNQYSDNLEGYCLRCRHPKICHEFI